ncbi:hypothetical protein CR513_44791, partial [Mucuna pruriens]
MLVDKGSSTNVEICGCIKLRTTFGTRSNVKIVLVKYTIIDARTLYNIILRWSTLNRLRAIMSTLLTYV